MIHLGPHKMPHPVILAPMAGITDLPFRRLCRKLGAGWVVGEMVTSDTRLWKSPKSKFRLDHTGEEEPRWVQIAGGDPERMIRAAQMNVERGAQIIDINMGCPAKKVCNKAAGSALLKDEKLVAEILSSVVEAVDVPVTLKTRTGWSLDRKNGIDVAKIAEDCGIQALSIHGRTRECRFKGIVDYEAIGEIASALTIPVFANGNIDSGAKAKEVLETTGADGVMVARAAQGKPWILGQIAHYLATGEELSPPSYLETKKIILGHLRHLHRFYGDHTGHLIARKHVGWYLKAHPEGESFRQIFVRLKSPSEQLERMEEYFDRLIEGGKEESLVGETVGS